VSVWYCKRVVYRRAINALSTRGKSIEDLGKVEAGYEKIKEKGTFGKRDPDSLRRKSGKA